MDESEFVLSGHRFKRYNESNFVLIFSQKYPSGGLFHSEEECNKSIKKNKYSVIGLIDDKYKLNEYFHFLLEYPELHSKLEFKQKLPITSTSNNVQPIYYNKSFSYFYGLAKSADIEKTCFDATPGEGTLNWWYSIGTIHSCETQWNDNVIPGPIQGVNYVKLWIRIREASLRICKERSFITFTSIFIAFMLS